MMKIPSVVLEEIDAFEAEIGRLRRNEIPEEKFKRFRLQQGIYGQRQKEDFMVRVKVPQGTLNPEQLRRLADIGLKSVYFFKYKGWYIHHVTPELILLNGEIYCGHPFHLFIQLYREYLCPYGKFINATFGVYQLPCYKIPGIMDVWYQPCCMKSQLIGEPEFYGLLWTYLHAGQAIPAFCRVPHENLTGF